MSAAPELLLPDTDGEKKDRTYRCSATGYAFHTSPAKVRLIMGPFGSGKSTACIMEIMRRAREQKVGPNGKRRSRWAVVRNTKGELRNTTIRSFQAWIPPTGIRPPRRFVQTPDANLHITEGDLDLEILFMALDKPDQIKRLLSLELTGAWINEAREIPLAIIEGIQGRCGRYPSFGEEGCTWSGVIMDTNPPDNDHHLYRMFEEVRPSNWEIFKQPSGRSPDGENLENLIPGYYTDLAVGKRPEWVKVYIDGEYGFIVEGKPVWPEYNDRVHCPEEPPRFDPKRPLLMGQDFGLTPAAIFAQRDVRGRWLLLEELIGDGMGIERFSEIARGFIAEKFPGIGEVQDIRLWGDPAGADPAQTDERTCFQIMRAQGFRPDKAPTQNFTVRREAVASALNRMVDGEPGFILSRNCPVLRKAMQGGYAYKRVAIAGEERYHDQPDKNRFSHVADATQYMMAGGGEAHELVRKKQPDPPRWDPVAAAKKQGYGRKGGSSWMGR